MPESKAKRDWMRKNTRTITIKLNNRTDADIIELLDRSTNKQGVIKNALRAEMSREAFTEERDKE